jgi:hypothetical protein
MPPPVLPLELLLEIAHHMRDDHSEELRLRIAQHMEADHGELRYSDFNSFLQVNRALYACLNRMLWKEAAEDRANTRRVFAHLIKTNNLAGFEFFLSLGADVEIQLYRFDVTGRGITGLEGDDDGVKIDGTPLRIAATLDNVPLATLLLSRGAKVEYSCSDGGEFSPLHAARSAEMVRLLLDNHADPEFEDDNDYRPLNWYAIRGDIAAMRAILLERVEVNHMRPYQTPLHQAVECNLDTVKLLMEHGADVEAGDIERNTPLHLAAAAGKTDVVKFLVEVWPEGMRKTNVYLDTPLHLAREVDVVKFLVEQWPEGKEALNSYGETPSSMFTRTFKASSAQ